MDRAERIAAKKLRDVVAEYCEGAVYTDRPTKSMCDALDEFDKCFGADLKVKKVDEENSSRV